MIGRDNSCAQLEGHGSYRTPVLTLSQLENVLLPVNDAQGALGCHLPNVAGVEPAVTAQHLS